MKIASFFAYCLISLGVFALTPEEKLGQQLFFDPILSKNKTQSCTTCHNPNVGFIDPRDNGVGSQASLGDDGTSLGDRNAPTVAYAKFSPDFHYDPKSKQHIGGQFWDGRAKNLEDQAAEPPLNPAEMNMPNRLEVIKRLKNKAIYAGQFKQIYGDDVFNDPNEAYQKMVQVIAEFAKSAFFSPFDSKYDRYLKDEYPLTDLEDLGMSLFFAKTNSNCNECHQLEILPESQYETFSNYQYHNIGVPANWALRAKNGTKNVDNGLINNPAVNAKKHLGKFKTPTLRNIAITAPYMHNGVFKELKTVIAFYDKYNNKKRTHNPETEQPWQSGEITQTINHQLLTQAKALTDTKIKALIAFLHTLTDKRYEHLVLKNEKNNNH